MAEVDKNRCFCYHEVVKVLHPEKWEAMCQALREAEDCHLLAFELDSKGVNHDRVSYLYNRATSLVPNNPLYWSRFVQFLIVRRRKDEAICAWRMATCRRYDRSKTLDFPVVLLAARFGMLNFAEEVIHIYRKDPCGILLRNLLEKIRDGSKIEWDDPNLPKLELDPNRYLAKENA